MAKGKKTGGRDFKPGQSGNPKGGPGLPKDLREARKLGQLELERAVNRLIYLSRSELRAVIENPDTPMFDITIASIIAQAAQKGDQQRLEFVLNRIIGRVKDQIEITQPKPFVVTKRSGEQVLLGAKVEETDQ
jgi:hypothetical protein